MLKKSKLNVFGDSYSTPGFCVAPQDSFWGLMSKQLGIDRVDNFSNPGFSLDHIVHIVLNETFDFEREYFVVGIPPLIRYVAYSDNYTTNWYKTCFALDCINQNKVIVESLNNTQKFKFEEQFQNDKHGAIRFSSEWNDIQCLEKIYLLHQFLILKKAKFVIVNLSNPIHYQDMWLAGKEIMKKVYQLNECIMFDNTYYSVNYKDKIKPVDFDLYGWNGHHGSEGNLNWYNKIIEPKIKELGWTDA